MNDLLKLAVEAHGGIERWNKVKAIKVAASVTGAIWHVKSKPDYLKNVVFEVETVRERVTMDFPGQNKRSVFEAQQGRDAAGRRHTVESRDDPERAFDGQTRDTPWDDMHVAYFSGEAFYTYFNTPFLYTRLGFSTEEIQPIEMDGQTWRRLKVTFPDWIKSHTKVQISCFGPDGLLRRHDYTVDILGGATGLNFAFDYRNVDGHALPQQAARLCVRGRVPDCQAAALGQHRHQPNQSSLGQITMATKSLFTPLQLGALELPHRIIMAPMTRMRAGAGNVPTSLNAEYYAQRASAALIISEGTAISAQAQGYPSAPGIYTEAQIEGWRMVVEQVHARGGRISMQIAHNGRNSHSSLVPDGKVPVAPSAVPPNIPAYTSAFQPVEPEMPRALEPPRSPRS